MTTINSMISQAGIPRSYLSTDGTFASDSDQKVPTEKAAKTYMDGINTDLLAAIATAVITGGASFLSSASYAGNIQDTLDAAAALGDTTKGAIVFIPPGDYSTSGLTYAPFVSIIGSGMSTRITMTGATGSVIGPELPAVASTHNIFANMWIDMDNQGDCGLMLEAIQHATVSNVKIFNIPDGTYTYNSVANIKRAGVCLMGKSGISGAYYNTLNNIQCQGTSTGDRGECGIYLSGVSGQPANFNRINQPKIFYCTTGIEVAVGGDNLFDMPEVSACDIGIWFTGSSLRNEARNIYAENMALVPTRVDSSASYSRIGPFANVTATTSKELFLTASATITHGETITVSGKDTSATAYGIVQSYNDGQQYSIIVTGITGTAFAVGDVLDGSLAGVDFATIKYIDTPLAVDYGTTLRARAKVDDRSVFTARGWIFGPRGLFLGHSFLTNAFDAYIDFEGASAQGKALIFRTNNVSNAMTERVRLTSGITAGSLTFANSACSISMGTGNNITIQGTWDGGHLILGSNHLWVDSTGDLRIKSSAPTDDIDGSVVGAQSYINDIGVPGAAGFGVGVCPSADLPSGFTPLSGYTEPTNENYGNYQYSDGSIMCWIPKFYYKYGTGANGVNLNSVDIKGTAFFADTATANAAGYALHRAFIDGGVEKTGFFVDKYQVSKVAKGTGYVGASVRNGLLLSTHADHNPMYSATPGVGLTACGSNAYFETIKAAHARDGVNGAENASSNFFVVSRFIYSALALLALAQQSGSDGWCAWFDAKPYPKGCNNNALRDTDDTSVLFQSDGYSNCGKTGSGVPFAKTTHNGQVCGVADLNGLMYEISTGITCIAASKTITGATQANPCVITIVGHGYTTGDMLLIASVGGMTQLNDKLYTITKINDDTFSLDGVNSSGYGAFTSGGSCTKGAFYAAKESTAMKNFTSGNSAATDHWGAVGVAAMMDPISIPFLAASGGTALAQRFGSGANQVLSEAVNGAGWLLTGLGCPKNASAIDGTGTDIFGKDYFYQYVRNDLCALSCGAWDNYSGAGLWALNWNNNRTVSSYSVGWRAACYPV